MTLNARFISGLPVVLKFLKCHRCPEVVLKSAIVLKFYSFGQSGLIWTLIFKICWHQVASFKAKMHQIWFWLGHHPRPCWGSLQHSPGRPLDGFELSNVNWTCLYMLIKVPVCFSSYNNNIYEDGKTCIFCVLSLVKPTKLSWNFLKIGSRNITSCSWEPCHLKVRLVNGTLDICLLRVLEPSICVDVAIEGRAGVGCRA